MGARAALAAFAAVVCVATAAASQQLTLHVKPASIPVSSSRGWLSVTLTDTSGAAVKGSPAAVYLKSAKSAAGKELVLEPVQAWLNEDGSFGFDMLKLQPDLGLHMLQLSAEAGDQAGSSSASVAVTGSVEVVNAAVGVETGSQTRDMTKVMFPKPARETLSLYSEGAKVVVELTVRRSGGGKEFAPHQALVRATHVESGRTAFFRARPTEGGHRATFTAAGIASQTDYKWGLFELTLLLGDVSMDQPIQWRLGQVDVPFERQEAARARRGPLPEILHQFRQPDKQFPAIIPLFFAGVQVSAFAGLLYVLLIRKSGSSGSSKLPNTPGGVLSALCFHGGIIGLLILYLVFWVRLSILTLLPPLTVGGVFTSIAGYFLLSHVARARVKAD